jgi:hypothetical protein
MMEDAAQAWTQHLRIAVLRSLLDLPEQTGHESLLVDLVNGVAIMADRDQVRGAISWLHEQNLVVAEVKRGALCAMLTERGGLVAEGKRSYPGVKKPSRALSAAAALALDQLKG